MFDPKNMIVALIRGDKSSVEEQVQNELKKGTPALEILNTGLVAGMDIVGEKMESEDMFIPDVLMAAKAMSAGVEILKSRLSEEDASARGRVVIGTVKGDLHDIGKNLVAIMIESAGLEVFNLGVDIAPDEVEDVAFDDDPWIKKGRKGTRYMLGYTIAGRYLSVVYVLRSRGVARVITAMDMDDKTRKLYKKRRKR